MRTRHEGKNMINIKKKIGALLLASSTLATATIAFPSIALAAPATGWDPKTMIEGTTGATNVDPGKIDANTFSGWVQSFTTFILGFAVVIFVLKVVLTAIDQMLFAQDGNKTSFLTNIPIVGAYKFDGGSRSGGPSFGGGGGNGGGVSSWKDVWIHFGKNIAIVAGAWIIVQIIMGTIIMATTAATSVTNIKGQ